MAIALFHAFSAMVQPPPITELQATIAVCRADSSLCWFQSVCALASVLVAINKVKSKLLS